MNLTFRDELPSTLLLPASLRESNSRQNLSAVALLGKDFWKYPMSENSTSEKKEKTGASGLFLKEAFFLRGIGFFLAKNPKLESSVNHEFQWYDSI